MDDLKIERKNCTVQTLIKTLSQFPKEGLIDSDAFAPDNLTVIVQSWADDNKVHISFENSEDLEEDNY